MSDGTFTAADSSLTSIAVSSNNATGTTVPDHHYVTGEPVCVSGGTVDTDINGRCYTITVTGAKTFTFTTSNVSNNTYTESGLRITNAHKFMAGCGQDCVLTYGYKDLYEYLAVDKNKWLHNNHLDFRNIPIPYPMPDWQTSWIPIIHPADAWESYGYLTHAVWTYPLARLAGGANAITPGDFASYKGAGYTADLLPQLRNFAGPSEGTGVVPVYVTTDTANVPLSIYPTLRLSLWQMVLRQAWEFLVEYQTLGMDDQRMTDLKGPATAVGCYEPWGMPWNLVFNVGAHKLVMHTAGIADGQRSAHDDHSNLWYISALTVNSGNCWGSPDNPIDVGYLQAGYLSSEQTKRPTGYMATHISAILATQAGRQWPDIYYHNSPDTIGQETGALLSKFITYDWRYTLTFFTTAEKAQMADDLLDLIISYLQSRSTSYWNTVFTNGNETGAGVNAAQCWNQGPDTGGDCIAMNLTLFKYWGGNATKISTLVGLLESFSAFSGHDFDADVSAATGCSEHDFGDGGPTFPRCSNMQ